MSIDNLNQFKKVVTENGCEFVEVKGDDEVISCPIRETSVFAVFQIIIVMNLYTLMTEPAMILL